MRPTQINPTEFSTRDIYLATTLKQAGTRIGEEISNRMARSKKEPRNMVPNRLHKRLRKAAGRALRRAEEEGLL